MRADRPPVSGAFYGLAAAALFGLNAPIAKLLLPGVDPLPLAGLLYSGGGLGLVAVGLARRAEPGAVVRETALQRADYGVLLAIIVAGGFVGPVLMLVGLQRVSAVFGSLLLNLEAPFTMFLAVTIFREHLGRYEAGGAALVILGATILSFVPGDMSSDAGGMAALTGACLSWAIDNNLTQRLALRDPVAVARAKMIGAGMLSLGLAVACGYAMPATGRIVAALVAGFGIYGVSVVFAVEALRRLGAAREAAYFATAPFVGAAVAVPLLGERLGVRELMAAAIMGSGVVALLRAEHAHPHAHEALEHDHAHLHDEHHRHDHDGSVEEPHAHHHVHAPLIHTHAHVSDVHHRHRH
ncbi:MAG TPA: DMT family transporter [Candidatus Nitrosopolaris sp.]|nr:DMT family transporter [Candidatus Nitrosopolaris sp.]